jgi:hypothetical protein
MRWADNLHVPIVFRSGSLNLLEPSGPVQACKGIALPLPFFTNSPDYTDQHMRANTWEGIGKEMKLKRNFYVSSRDVRIVCTRL